MAEVIIRPGRTYPVFAGSLPSTSGGRRRVVLTSIDQEGTWHTQSEDLGPEQGQDAPILFIPFGGVDYALTKEDVKEMLAGMRERHEKWRAKQPPPPDWNEQVWRWGERLKKAISSKQQYYMKESIQGDNDNADRGRKAARGRRRTSRASAG